LKTPSLLYLQTRKLPGNYSQVKEDEMDSWRRKIREEKVLFCLFCLRTLLTILFVGILLGDEMGLTKNEGRA
jgi:hypothetical protein